MSKFLSYLIESMPRPRFPAPGVLTILVLAAPAPLLAQSDSDRALVSEPYHLDTGLTSRSISFENPTGEPGKGGSAVSRLGPGRKGAPAKMFLAGTELQLADIEGPGTIRHIWMTLDATPTLLRGLVIRVWWDGQAHPSIEAPVGDFFGFAHGHTEAFQTAVHSVGERYGMNIWLPMPFTRRARITVSNETDQSPSLYYQVDYTVGDGHTADVGRLHTLFRRENPTTKGKDFEILPERQGKGRYIGAVLGIRTHKGDWWGEGEVKMYLDDDRELATIVGTGSEDYIGLSYGMQQTPFLYHGATLTRPADGISARDVPGEVSMYRWHLPDPVYWNERIRVSIQQIGFSLAQLFQRPDPSPVITDFTEITSAYFEREDDWSAATFWYEPVPSEPLPELPALEERLVDDRRAPNVQQK